MIRGMIVLLGASLFSTMLFAAELGKIRVGQTPERTRVVFEIKQNHQFKVHRLKHPSRIVVDFYQTKSHILFHKKTFNDKVLISMRVKRQPQKNRIRVVLDLRKSVAYRYFTLAKNHRGYERVVIDLFSDNRRKKNHSVSVHDSVPSVPSKSPVKVARSAIKREEKHKVVNKIVNKKVAKTPSIAKATSKPHQKKRLQKPLALSLEARNILQMLTAVPAKGDQPIVVAIDPGHGGRDTGAIGANGTYEKRVTLKLAKRLKHYIDSQPYMKAVLTRTKDVFIPLSRRVEIAHQKHADIFISIHADAYQTEEAKGCSVYVLSTQGASSLMAKLLAKSENASLLDLEVASSKAKDVTFALSDMAREANIRASHQLARSILGEMQKTVRVHKHTVQSANFVVLKSIDMPSLLIETAFISNPIEERNLRSKHFQSKVAKSIARGVKRFVARRSVKPAWGETLFVRYKVQPGDTLSEIAENYKVSTRVLMRLNQLKNPNQLYVGKPLKIPLTSRLVANL